MNLENLVLRALWYLKHGEGDPVALAHKIANYVEEMMATDREQEVELGQSLESLSTKVDGLVGKVDTAVSDLTGLRTQVADLITQLEEAQADDVELSDEIATANAIAAKVDEATNKLTAPTPEPAPEPEPTPEPVV